MHSLTWKISLPIILSIWVLFGIAGYMAYQSRRKTVEQLMQASVMSNLVLSSRAIGLLMLSGPPEHVRDLMEGAARDLDWIALEAQSPDGKHQIRVNIPEPPPGSKATYLTLERPLPGNATCGKCHKTDQGTRKGYLRAAVNLDRFLKPVRLWYWRAMGIHFAASFLLMGIVGLSVMYWVRRPIRSMTKAMERVAQGDLSVDWQPRGQDEIAEVGRYFASMVARLRELQAEREREQQMQLQRAEQLATVGQMAAYLAHELKNPLAGISSALAVLFERGVFDAEVRDVYHDIQEDLTRINRVLEDLLQYARPRPMEWQQTDVMTLVDATLRRLAQVAEEHGVALERDVAEDIPACQGDPNQLQQMLYNLILNAIQATFRGGMVTVGARYHPEADEIELWVEDTGTGIEPEKIPEIFKPFYSTKLHGTGLGLPICMRIVENHGGRLEVASRPGHGSRFTVYLPVRPPEPSRGGFQDEV